MSRSGITKNKCNLPLTDEQRDLAERYVLLARKLAKPLKVMFPRWRDEFDSAACLALITAARSFDPSRKMAFATFARFRIRGALAAMPEELALKGFRRETVRKEPPRVVSLGFSPISDDEPVHLGLDAVDAVEAWLRKLPANHAEVCRLHYIHGETMAGIGKQLGISTSEVTRLHRLAIKLLTPAFDDDGNPIRSGIRTRKVKSCSGSASAKIPA